MKLITETLDSDIQVITEAKQNGSKDYFIEGVFMMADMPNRNKRVYESRVLQPAVEKYIEQQPSFPFLKAIQDGLITSQGILLSRHFPTPLLKRMESDSLESYFHKSFSIFLIIS